MLAVLDEPTGRFSALEKDSLWAVWETHKEKREAVRLREWGLWQMQCIANQQCISEDISDYHVCVCLLPLDSTTTI